MHLPDDSGIIAPISDSQLGQSVAKDLCCVGLLGIRVGDRRVVCGIDMACDGLMCL